MKFGDLIPRKSLNLLPPQNHRCQILRLKCTKFNFGWGSSPHSDGGAYSALPDPLAGYKGPTCKGGDRKGWGIEGWEGKRERKKGREGREGKWWEGEKWREPPRVGAQPHVRNPEKYPDTKGPAAKKARSPSLSGHQSVYRTASRVNSDEYLPPLLTLQCRGFADQGVQTQCLKIFFSAQQLKACWY